MIDCIMTFDPKHLTFMQDAVSSSEWAVLLQQQPPATTGQVASEAAAPRGPQWLSPPRWQAVCSAAATVPALAALPDGLLEKPEAWQAVYEAAKPHEAALPGVWCLLSDVQRLIVLRALRQIAFMYTDALCDTWYGLLDLSAL